MAPSAPGRFSTTIGTPSCADTGSITVRVIASAALPAVIGEITRIGLSGQGWAASRLAVAIDAPPAAIVASCNMVRRLNAGCLIRSLGGFPDRELIFVARIPFCQSPPPDRAYKTDGFRQPCFAAIAGLLRACILDV